MTNSSIHYEFEDDLWWRVLKIDFKITRFLQIQWRFFILMYRFAFQFCLLSFYFQLIFWYACTQFFIWTFILFIAFNILHYIFKVHLFNFTLLIYQAYIFMDRIDRRMIVSYTFSISIRLNYMGLEIFFFINKKKNSALLVKY